MDDIMYEILSKSDFQSGAALTVSIPEEELDKKALYTILSEQPDFLLPFRHIIVDGQVEFTYQIGNRSKLAYLSGNRSSGEYADLWFNILHPLLDCDDWFMNPYSFVLKPEYLYCDNSKAIFFVYIPSVRACSDYNALKSMVTEVARQNHVTDVTLENKVVWAIQDFSLTEFLQMLRPYRGYASQDAAASPAPAAEPPPPPPPPPPQRPVQPEPPASKQSAKKQVVEQQIQTPAPPPAVSGRPDDIAIIFPPDGKEGKKEKSLKLPTPKKEKTEKPKKEPKEKGGFPGKKQQQQDIIQGAAAMPIQGVAAMPVQQSPPVYATPPGMYSNGATQIDLPEAGGPKFRYIGNGAHPGIITVPIAAGGIFTIGRFDPSAGAGQSSFEFSTDTKAVSRRHAVVERNAEGFVLIDLNSSAGTFINGQQIQPNTPYKLERGCRVSFGYSGADYSWEE